MPGAWRGTPLELAGLAGVLLDQVGAAVIAVDTGGMVTYWNPEAERALGWARGDVLGRELGELLADPAYSPLQTTLAGQRWAGRLTVRSKAGGDVAGWATCSPLRVPDGAVAGAVAIIQIGAAGTGAHDPLDHVLAGLDAGVVLQDLSGALIYANGPAALALGSGSPDELLAAPLGGVRDRFEVFDEDGSPVSTEQLPGRLVLAGGEPVERLLRFRTLATGAEGWSTVRATPVRDSDGRLTGAISIFRDVTARRRTEESLRFLAQAGALLGHSLDWEATLGGVARLAVPAFADWCIVDVIERDQTIRRVAVAAANPRDQDVLEDLRRRYSPSWDSPQPAARALREGASVIIDEFTPEALAETVVDAEHLRLMTELAPRSSIAVPLVAHGRTLGVVTFAWSRSDHRYVTADLPFAEEIARRAAIAVANARLYKAEQEARQQLVFLAEASAALATSLDYELTLERVAQLAVPKLADWCVIDVLDADETVRRVAVVCADPAKQQLAVELGQSYPDRPMRREGTSKVLASGLSELISAVTDDWLEAIAPDPRQFEILSSLGLVSNILVPLIARGRTIGVLTIATAESGRIYGLDELAVAEDLGRRAALAVDNARLFHEAEARGDAARALAYVADGVVLLDEQGIVRFWNPAAAEITGFSADDVLARSAAEAIPGWTGVSARVRIGTGPGAGGARAETLPLDLGGREVWLSISAVRFAEGIVYAFRDLTEERALERLRSDFVSTVSHELRTPLAAIYGAAARRLHSCRLPAREPVGRDLGGGRAVGPDGQRHPVGESARLGHPARCDAELRRRRSGSRCDRRLPHAHS
jgi:PAS domain S-box-containing protein